MGCCMSISQATVGIQERWGKFDQVLHPGFHCLYPCCGESVTEILNLRVQQLNVNVDSITYDKVSVALVISVQFKINTEEDQIQKAHYTLDNYRGQIASYVEDTVRTVIPSLTLDKVFETKQEIAQAVKDRLSAQIEEYGFTIVQSLVTDIQPAKAVVESMNRINVAERARVAAENEGEAKKIMSIKAAEADAESKFLSGEGIARQRQAIVKGLETSVSDFTGQFDGINPQEVMSMIMLTQYFDTLAAVGTGSNSQVVFIPHTPGAMGDIQQQVSQAMMQGNAANMSMSGLGSMKKLA